MKYVFCMVVVMVILVVLVFLVLVVGQFNIFNFGFYMLLDFIVKFEKIYDVKVIVIEYDFNESVFVKIQVGGYGFDIIVFFVYIVFVYIQVGFLMKSELNQMLNFKNVKFEWVDMFWDKGCYYMVFYVWGMIGVMVNIKVYKGDINIVVIIFDLLLELKGKINVVFLMNEVIDLVINYVGGEVCMIDKVVLKKVYDKLMEVKVLWVLIDYLSFEKFIKEDFNVLIFWNGVLLCICVENFGFVFGFLKMGYLLWQDNVVIFNDVKNVENVKFFFNFLMDLDNVVLVLNYMCYGNVIIGLEVKMDFDLFKVLELIILVDLKFVGYFMMLCLLVVQDFYVCIWMDLIK